MGSDLAVLREMLPYVSLGVAVTPVDEVDDGLWVKRDDLTSSEYGGNKVRKLEWVLAAPARRGATLLTAGGIGSHHIHAVAQHGAALGLRTEAVVYDVEVADDPDAALGRLEELGVRIHRIGSEYLMPIELARRLRSGVHLIWPGASTPAGTLGYVEAGLELAGQLPERVATVVVALGSGGTAVGLALGLALGGRTEVDVLAPMVSSRLVTAPTVLGVLEAGTRTLLALGGLRPPAIRLSTTDRYLGDGYGVPSDAGKRATAVGHALGIPLERTYTAKAFAAALDFRAERRPVLFVQTWAGSHLHD